jgi:paraquat-inducible protein B
MNTATPPPHVEGEVVPARRQQGLAWTWLFPVLALGVTGWLWWEREAEKGPNIEISFAEAPGIEPGKTQLLYRGVEAGRVTAVRLDNALSNVIVSVQLRAYASGLARTGTQFWIEKPVVSLHGVQGLESLIQGNSIHALVADSHGRAAYSFVALEEAPLSTENAALVSFVLEAESIPFIARGTPVFHRGTQVGWISEKELDPDGRALAGVVIHQRYAHTVRNNSRFWLVSAASISASPGQVQLNLPSIAAILDGGVSFDHFEKPGQPAPSGHLFELSANEIAARADGPRLTIDFPTAIAMRSGETRVTYLGQPVGVVEKLETRPSENLVRATVRIAAEIAHLVDSSAEFYFVRPTITWKGIGGLETLVTGPYINFQPGLGGEAATEFVGITPEEEEERLLLREYGGLRVMVRSSGIPQIDQGAPVYFQGLPVGAVLRKAPSSEGGMELLLGFRPEYSDLVRQSSRFWRVPATQATVGPGTLQVEIAGIMSLLHSGLAFAQFPDSAPAGREPQDPAEPGQVFTLFDSPILAAATSPPIEISFTDGRGLLAGQTQLRYRGLPVGVVEQVEIKPQRVIATARFFPGYDFLRRQGSQFAVIRPEISLQGVSGLQTLVSGVYISCVQGDGTNYAASFQGVEEKEGEILVDRPGLEVLLSSRQTKIEPGALITFNDMAVGEITRKSLSPSGREVYLHALIFEEFRHLLRSNSVFWDSSGVKAKIGFLQIRIDSPTLLEPGGRVAFFTPDPLGDPVSKDSVFPLNDRVPRGANR